MLQPFRTATLLIAASLTATAFAADGSWSANANGNWTDSANWTGGIIADGTGATAAFTNDITGDRTVTLGADRTIGNLTFGDADTGTAGSWFLTGNTLTLDHATGSATVTVGALGSGKYARIASVVAGASALVKAGTGELRLSVTNTYTGGTVVNAGMLTADLGSASGAKSVFGTGAITVNAGATLRFFAGSTGNGMSHANAIALNGATLISEDAVQTYSGAITLTGANTVNVVWGGKNAIFSGGVSGTGSLTKTGSGSLILTGTNTYTGTTTISGGTFEVSGAGTLGSGTYAAAIVNNGTFRFASSANQILTGSISGSGNLIKDGTGTLVLNGSNSFGGGTTVNGGVLAVDGNQSSNRLPSNAQVTVNNTGVFEIRGVNALPGGGSGIDVAVNDGGTLRVVTGGSAVIGAGGTSHAHLRNLTLNGGTVDLTYSGGGSAYNGESFQLNGDVTVGGTKVSVIQSSGAGANTGTTGIALKGTRTFTVNDAVAGAGVDLIVSAELEDSDNGAGGLIKAGAGTMLMSGANSYTGTTTLAAGTLVLDYSTNDNSKLANGAALILNGGTLELRGGTHGETVGSTTLNGAVSITRASGAAVLHLGAITVNGGAIDFGADAIATTTNANVNGILGGWATVAGTDFATRDANGFIVAYTGYTQVARLGGALADDATANIAIVESGTAGGVSLAGAGITTINALINKAGGGDATVDLTGGTLRLGASGGIVNAVNAGALTLTGGAITAGGAADIAGLLTVTNFSTSKSIVIGSVITDNGTGVVSLNKTGAGVVELNAANTFTGTVTIAGGALRLNHVDAIGHATLHTGATGMSPNLVFGIAGTNSYSVAALTGTGTVALGGNSLAVGGTGLTSTFGGILSGTGGLTKNGAGSLTLTGINTFTGETIVNGGTLTIANQGSVYTYASTLITINNGATLGITGGRQDFGNQTFAFGATGGGSIITGVNTNWVAQGNWIVRTSGGAKNTIGGATGINLNNANRSITFDIARGTDAFSDLDVLNSIGNSGGTLTKTGSGRLTLKGANSYTGGTFVNAGTLITGNTAALSTGSVTVASGATLRIGDGTVNNVILGAGANLVIDGTLGLGSATSSISLAGSGGFNFTNGILDLGGVFDSQSGLTEYQLITGGTGSKTGTTNVTGFDRNVFESVILDNNGILHFTPSAIPEPATYGLLGAGALALAAIRRRKRA